MPLLSDWLGVLGLAQYAQVFVDNDIDLDLMSSLSEQDLEKLGLSMGHRKRLLKAIAERDSPVAKMPAQVTPPTQLLRATAESKLPATASRDTGERRHLTVLFCDMVGSTELASLLDPEVLREVMRAYENACVVCIKRYDGHVFQLRGDGIVAFFGYPMAHEGEAHRAIHAGLSIIDALAASDIAEVGHLSVRIGIATGLAVVSSAEGAAGETVNLAARLQGVAPTDTIVVSERVRQLAGASFVYDSLGEQTLKGIRRPTAAYRIVGVSAISSRFEAATHEGLTPMVGREQEVSLLMDRWQQAQGGEGQVVLLSGEPGIGKSRALNALRERLESDGVNALRLQCSPYCTTSALYPSIDNFERALKYARDESPDAKLDKLEALIVGHYGRPRGDVRYIAAMLSIPFESRYGAVHASPKRFKDETFRCLVDLTEAAARRQPTVMLFEDAHWADPTSLEMLDLLIDRVKGVPLLIVITHRPEFQSRWSGRGHVAALTLSKLAKAQSAAIVSELTRGKALPGNLLEQILTKTDGVPLFVEELTKSVLESGDLQDAGDHYEYTGGTAHGVSIPASLRDSLMSRLDRYAPIKEIAQIGSVIGREFSYELIHAVTSRTRADLEQALGLLNDSGLAGRRGTPPNARYMFKHALVRDAAYDSLLKSRRQELHGKIARVLEDRFPASKDAEPELLAHHFGAAGLAEPAITYWLKAAKRAADRSAYREALTQLDAGTALLESVPAGRERTLLQMRLQLQRAAALVATHGWSAAETGSAYAATRALCDQLGDDVRDIIPALYGSATFHFARSELRLAEATARELLRRARQIDDPALLLVAHYRLGGPLLNRGALRDAAEHLAHAVRLYDPVRDRESALLAGVDFKAASLGYQSHAFHFLGAADQALAASREARHHAESLGRAYATVAIMWFEILLTILRRDPARAVEQAARAMTLAEKHGFPQWHAVAKLMSGIAVAELGETPRGMSLIRTYLGQREAMGLGLNRPLALAALATGEARSKRWEAAAGLFDEALGEVEGSDERWYEAEIHRLRGEFLLARGGAAAATRAEACFDRSLRVARAQSAKAWELRTATSLAKLWQGQDRREQAHALLDPVCRWFTEGFDTLDLKDAKALLGELAT